MAKEITNQEYKDCTEHYERMIKCIEKLCSDMNLFKQAKLRYRRPSGYLEYKIGETITSTYCPLCIKYTGHICSNCPLFLNGYYCSDKNSPWSKLNSYDNWTDLNKFLEALKTMNLTFDKLPEENNETFSCKLNPRESILTLKEQQKLFDAIRNGTKLYKEKIKMKRYVKEEMETTNEITNHIGVVFEHKEFVYKGFVVYSCVGYRMITLDKFKFPSVFDDLTYLDVKSMINYFNIDIIKIDEKYLKVKDFYMFDSKQDLFKWLAE